MSVQLQMLRHGETERGGGFRGSLDDALTEQGWAQMRAATQEQGPWDVVVSSPLQRCAAFAVELGAQRQLPVVLDSDFRELHFGEWEGCSAAQIMEQDAEALGRFWADPYAFQPPGGEPLVAFEARVLGALERLQRAYAGQRVLLISHGGVMRLLLARARGLPRGELLQVEVAHASLHPLQLSADYWQEGR